MASATAETQEKFNCTAAEFYKIVTDYEKYSEFLPEVKSIKVKDTGKGTKEMDYSVNVIKTFSYKLKANEIQNKEVNFKFVSGDVFKTMEGSWKIHDKGDTCLVDYKVEASFGMLVPGAMAKTIISAQLPMMMANFKKRVKQIYGK